MSIFKRESLFALLAVSVFIGGCGGGGGGNTNAGGGGAQTPVSTFADIYLPGPQNQVVNASVDFFGVDNSSDTSGSSIYRWDFGDGATASTQSASHQYTQAGTYTVKFSATTATGVTATKTVTQKVVAAKVEYVAGAVGGAGRTNGAAEVARFNSPSRIAAAPDGSVYLLDGNSNVVRKVATDGTTSILAGSLGVYEYREGAQARFQSLSAIATDSGGNVYVADMGSIRKISPAGVVSKLATDNNFSVGSRPIAVDRSTGTVLGIKGYSIIKLAGGQTTTLAGDANTSGEIDDVGTAARFKNPIDIATDGYFVYVIDSCTSIRKIAPNGSVTTVRYTPPSQYYGNCYGTSGIAVDNSESVYLANEREIVSVDRTGALIHFAGNPPGDTQAATPQSLIGIRGLTRSISGDLFVTGRANVVQKIAASTGNVTTVAGVGDDVLFSSADAPRFGSGSRVAKYIGGVMLATDGTCVQAFQPGTSPTVFAGQCGISGQVDGPVANARFTSVAGIAVDSQNNVFLAENRTHTIRKISTNGIVSTYAGSTGSGGSADGPRLSASFAGPNQLAVDNADNLWVLEDFGRIRMITPAGEVKTMVSTMSLPCGSASTPNDLCSLTDLVADRAGGVFMSGRGSNSNVSKIFRIDAAGSLTTYASSPDSALQQQPVWALGRLAVGPNGDLWAIGSPSTNIYGSSPIPWFIRHILPGATTANITALYYFNSKADASGPSIEFYRPIEGAAFTDDGRLMMVGGATAFMATGLE